MSVTHDPKSNHLLAALPAVDWERLAPHLTLVELPLGHVVYESGDQQGNVYFPTNSIISLLYVMEDGASAEIAIVGNEGMVGIAILWGAKRPRAARSCKAPGTDTA